MSLQRGSSLFAPRKVLESLVEQSDAVLQVKYTVAHLGEVCLRMDMAVLAVLVVRHGWSAEMMGNARSSG